MRKGDIICAPLQRLKTRETKNIYLCHLWRYVNSFHLVLFPLPSLVAFSAGCQKTRYTHIPAQHSYILAGPKPLILETEKVLFFKEIAYLALRCDFPDFMVLLPTGSGHAQLCHSLWNGISFKEPELGQKKLISKCKY